ncbi:hypothetical protein EFE32_07045 [Lactococcus lactis subsp. lactis]|uniref:hypothetical protein n=1 Tax=Lactococcus lactis TaxID=1358 RepID=UPI00223BA3DE|nr:hypothetical protein [Lactococcus lactis]MCT0016599.1 hypothetical protein [Lactococcus lactis subsp. lactis]
MVKKFFAILCVLVMCILVFRLIVVSFSLIEGLGEFSESSQSLYRMVSGIDWGYFFLVLIIFALVNLITNIFVIITYGIIIWVMQPNNSNHHFTLRYAIFSHYFIKYKSIHLFFLLLTLFMTISIAAPSTIMNSFMAIVGISTLVSTLTNRKKDKNEDK